MEASLKICKKSSCYIGHSLTGLTALHLAVESKDEGVVEELLNNDVDIDAVDGKSGRTALFLACEQSNKPLVSLLVERGANVNLGNFAGVSPASIAALRQAARILSILVAHGADSPTPVTPALPDVRTPASPQVANKACIKMLTNNLSVSR
jgi:ankyrin repeat protein